MKFFLSDKSRQVKASPTAVQVAIRFGHHLIQIEQDISLDTHEQCCQLSYNIAARRAGNCSANREKAHAEL
ncbi:hypothetical protein [Ensifer aridi]|uniref:hypothetical protein n=1 Tax=Ensifer aridi TaxID=1708715 RepID=UPI0011117F31|nr:hypothetical protein [Ensifer aridi]